MRHEPCVVSSESLLVLLSVIRSQYLEGGIPNNR
jgi:hypothetical protein